MKGRYEQFTGLISSINRSIQKIEREEMVKYGYKGAYAQYLTVLERNPEGLTAAQLCELSDRDKAAVSRIVAEMVDKGLVVRESANDNLYRAKIKLTDEGRRVADHVAERAVAAVEAGGQGLTDENRTAFYEALSLIADNLQHIGAAGLPE